MIYTDGLYNTNALHSIEDYNGDMPVVVASWTGTKNENGWTFTPNTTDIWKPQAAYPSQTQIDDTIQRVKRTLYEKTGYTLRHDQTQSTGSTSRFSNQEGR